LAERSGGAGASALKCHSAVREPYKYRQNAPRARGLTCEQSR